MNTRLNIFLAAILGVFLSLFCSCENKNLNLKIRNPLAIPPIPPQSIIYNTSTTNPNLSPWIRWSEGLDKSTLGLESYEIAIGSTRCATDVVDWMNLKTAYALSIDYHEFAIDILNGLTESNDYYISIRSKDNFGQVGKSTCGDRFTYSSNGWKQEAYFKAENLDALDYFGSSVAIEGDTVVIGAPFESSNQNTITNGTSTNSDNTLPKSGAVYVYRKTGGVWQQEAYIKASNSDADDSFGVQVAISGDTIAVSSQIESSNDTTITNGTTSSANNSAQQTGAVYIYKRTGTNWDQEAYIKASNSNAGDLFGTSISLDSDTLVVGAPGEDSNVNTITNGNTSSNNNSQTNSGAVYVYKRTGANWVQEAYIKASNTTANLQFGSSVDVSGDTIAAGVTEESSNQTTITNGTTSSNDTSISKSGAVYVYKRTGANWVQEAYIKASNATANLQFGHSLSISGDTVAVGAIGESSNQTTIANGSTSSNDTSLSKSGAVYVYKRTGVNWAQEAYIKAANADAGDDFGTSVSLSADTLAISAPMEDSNSYTVENGESVAPNNHAQNSGAVYIYKRSGTTWTQNGYIKAFNVNVNFDFGYSVSINGSNVVVGSELESSGDNATINGPTASFDVSASAAGAAYIYAY